MQDHQALDVNSSTTSNVIDLTKEEEEEGGEGEEEEEESSLVDVMSNATEVEDWRVHRCVFRISSLYAYSNFMATTVDGPSSVLLLRYMYQYRVFSTGSRLQTVLAPVKIQLKEAETMY